MSKKKNQKSVPVAAPVATAPAAAPVATAPVIAPVETVPVVAPVETVPVAAPVETVPVVAPATLPVLAPVQKGKAAPFMQQVRELLSGDGHPVAFLCEKLGLSDKDARGVIDAIRAKEGKGTVLNVYSAKAGRKVFRYVGLDGKGIVAPVSGAKA